MGLDGAQSRRADATADIAQLDAARLGLHRTAPHRSAKHVVHFAQILAFAGLGFGLYWAWRAAPQLSLDALHVVALALFALAVSWRLVAASSLAQPISRIAAPAHWPTYTILC